MPPEKIVANFTYTDQELLDLVNEAIATVTKFNQSFSIRGRDYTRADLPALMQMKTNLEQRINRSSSGLARNLVRLKRRP